MATHQKPEEMSAIDLYRYGYKDELFRRAHDAEMKEKYGGAPDLGASEIACAVADAAAVLWVGARTGADVTALQKDLTEKLARLEAATRGSALRKVGR